MSNKNKKTPVEVLISLRKTPDIEQSEAHASQRLAFDLLSLQSEGYDGKKIIDIVAKKSRSEIVEPAHTNLQDILLNFGAGTSFLNKDTKSVDTNPQILHSSDNLDQEKVASLNQAKKIVKPVYILQIYLDVISDHINTDQSPEDILKRMRGIYSDLQNITWQDLENKALEVILKSDSLKIIFPELTDETISNKEKTLFLSHSLLREPKFRLILARKMIDIKTSLSNLPKLEIFEEEELLIKRKEEERKKQFHQVKVLINYIQQYVPHLHPTEMIKLQEFLQETEEVTTSGIKYEVEQMVAHSFGISTVLLNDLKEKDKLKKEVESLESRVQDPSNVGLPDEELDKMKEKLEIKTTELNTRFQDPELEEHAENLEKIKELFQKDKTEEHPEGFAMHIIDIIIAHSQNIVEHENSIKRLQETAEGSSKKQIKTRLQEEAKYIDQISTVIDETLIQLVTTKYDEITIYTQKRMEAIDKEQIKQNDNSSKDDDLQINPLEKEKAQDLKTLSEVTKLRWIEFNLMTKEHIVHFDHIKNDILTILYQGEEGFKSLLQRDLGISEAEVISKADQRRIDVMYKIKGKYYRRKLLRDFFVSRIYTDYKQPKLKLRDHEWNLFFDMFKQEINETIETSQEAKRLIYFLEGKGIKPNKKIKWLIYILIIMKIGFVGYYANVLLNASNPKQDQENKILKEV